MYKNMQDFSYQLLNAAVFFTINSQGIALFDSKDSLIPVKLRLSSIFS